MIKIHEIYENVCVGGIVPDNGFVIIPKGMEKITLDAFADENVRRLILPDGMLGIEERAFKGHALAEIDIPGSTMEVYSDAFAPAVDGHETKVRYRNENRPYLFLPEAFGSCVITRLEIGNFALSVDKVPADNTIWRTYIENNQAAGIYTLNTGNIEGTSYQGFWWSETHQKIAKMIIAAEWIEVEPRTTLMNEIEADPERFAKTILNRDLAPLTREMKSYHYGEEKTREGLVKELTEIKRLVLKAMKEV